MKHTLQHFFLFVTAVAVIGCSPRLCPSRDVQQTRTVTVEERERDSLVIIRPDSSLMCARVTCDRGVFRLRDIVTVKPSERVHMVLGLDEDGVLTAEAVVDSMAIYLKLKDRYTTDTTVRTEKETVTETVEVNILRWWQKALMWLGAAMLVLIIIKAVKAVIDLRLNGIQSVINSFKKLL